MGKKLRVKDTRVKAINTLSAFLFSLLFFISTSIIILSYTVLSPRHIIIVLGKRDFYKNSYYELCEQLELIAEPAGIDPDVLIQTTDSDKLKKDIDNYIAASFKQSVFSLDTDRIEAEYFNALSAYAKNQGYTVDGELAENLRNIANAVAEKYLQHVRLPLIDIVGALSASFKKYLAVVLIFSLVLIFTLTCCVFIINHWRHRAMRVFIQSIISSGIMLSALPAFVLILGKYKHINILSEGLYLFVLGYIESILKLFICSGILALLLGVLLMLTAYRKMYRRALSH